MLQIMSIRYHLECRARQSRSTLEMEIRQLILLLPAKDLTDIAENLLLPILFDLKL